MGSSMQSRWWFKHLSAIIYLSASLFAWRKRRRSQMSRRGATRKRMSGESRLLQRAMSSDGPSIEIYSDKDKWDAELIECIIPPAIENAHREWNAINSIRWTSTEEWNTYGFVDRRSQQDGAHCVSAGPWTAAQALQTRPGTTTSGSLYSAVFVFAPQGHKFKRRRNV